MFVKILKTTISLICLAFLFSPVLILPTPVQALDASTPKLQIPDLNVHFSPPTECGSDAQGNKILCINWIGEYIAGIYKYAIGIIGILSAVVLMVGGVLWIVAGGSATMIGEAKAWIGASLTGLVIALCSYLILYQINPALTVFQPLKITLVKKAPEKVSTVNCQWVQYFTPEDFALGALCDNLGPGWTQKDGSCNAATKPSEQSVCCCPIFGSIAMCKTTAPFPSYCESCLDCETTMIPCKETPCLINKDLNEKLKALYALNTGWWINEPWPPTVLHSSACHKNGTCIDINLTSVSISGNTCDAVNLLLIQARSIFGASKVLNEYGNCGGTTYTTTTGNNIHISL